MLIYRKLYRGLVGMPRCSVSVLIPLQDRRRVKFAPLLLPHGLQAVVSGVIINELNSAEQPELLLRGCIPTTDLNPAADGQLLSLVAPAQLGGTCSSCFVAGKNLAMHFGNIVNTWSH